MNETLLAKAAAEKVLKVNQLRADSTVVPANVTYPTDSGLLVRAICLIVSLVARIHSADAATRTPLRDRRRAASRRARSISAHLKLRNDEAKATVLSITGELAELTEATVAELDTVIARSGAVVAQTRSRLGGDMPASATRVVSMHDPDARAIAKGRLGKPVEFGYKAQVVDNVDGVIVDHSVHQGNPADASLLAPAIKRVKDLVGNAPRAVTADRGYGEAKVEDDLGEPGSRPWSSQGKANRALIAANSSTPEASLGW